MRWDENGIAVCVYSKHKENRNTEESHMKGFIVHNGYMGCVDGSYLLFASETDYREYMED